MSEDEWKPKRLSWKVALPLVLLGFISAPVLKHFYPGLDTGRGSPFSLLVLAAIVVVLAMAYGVREVASRARRARRARIE